LQHLFLEKRGTIQKHLILLWKLHSESQRNFLL